MKDSIFADANVRIDVMDAETGQVLASQELRNLVVTAGRNLLRDFLNRAAVTGVSHFAVGIGTNAVTAADTALQTHVFRDVLTRTTASDGGLQVQYFLASGSANGHTLTEAGLFNAAAAGTMYARVRFGSSIVKTAAIAVTFAWDLTFST